MVLVKINTPVHYHVKKYRICKNKICQGPGTLFDGNMVVSAGMAHIVEILPQLYEIESPFCIVATNYITASGFSCPSQLSVLNWELSIFGTASLSFQ